VISTPYKHLKRFKDEIEKAIKELLEMRHIVNVYAIIIVLCISIDNNNIKTRSMRNTQSQETHHLFWETL
jgi:hypothetical protein